MPGLEGERDVFFSFLAENITITNSALTVKEGVPVNLFGEEEYILMRDDYTGGSK